MLENIKLILGITDTKYDDLIMLYLSKVETVVVAYTNVKELSPALASFIEDKVCRILKTKVKTNNSTNGEVKSISRGDTTIQYNVADATDDISLSSILSVEEKQYLNSFRPTSWRLL